MFALVSFIGKTGLSSPYSYSVSDELAKELKPNDYVVVQSARTDYSVGILVQCVESIPDPSIVTKAVVQKVDVPGYSDLFDQSI